MAVRFPEGFPAPRHVIDAEEERVSGVGRRVWGNRGKMPLRGSEGSASVRKGVSEKSGKMKEVAGKENETNEMNEQAK